MIYFIVNPAAGNGSALKTMQKAKKILDGNKILYKIVDTEYPGHGVSIARDIAQAAKKAEVTIVAVGGDGSLAEVIQGILAAGAAREKVKLGVLPSGSGNDFIRSFSISRRPAKALAVILAGRCQWIDALKVNGVYALNVACLGIDAQIARWTEGIKKYFGKFSYFISALKHIFTYRCLSAEIEIDGVRKKGNFVLLAAANGQYYGGGFRIAPQASLTDGYITFCCVDALPWYKILAVFPALILQKHTRLGCIHYYNCTNVVINYNHHDYVFIVDGNEITTNGTVHIEVVPHGLRMLC